MQLLTHNGQVAAGKARFASMSDMLTLAVRFGSGVQAPTGHPLLLEAPIRFASECRNEDVFRSKPFTSVDAAYVPPPLIVTCAPPVSFRVSFPPGFMAISTHLNGSLFTAEVLAALTFVSVIPHRALK